MQAAVIYDVNRTVGSGTVAGTIQTDGTFGVIATGNILDWNLVLNVGTFTYTLTGPSSGDNSYAQITGQNVTASATQLMFDFSGANGVGDFIFQDSVLAGSGQHYYCVSSALGGCLPGESVVPGAVSNAGFVNVAVAGVQSIGTVGNPSAVPEPGNVGAVLTVLVGLLVSKTFATQRPSRRQ